LALKKKMNLTSTSIGLLHNYLLEYIFLSQPLLERAVTAMIAVNFREEFFLINGD
jgi:hypothetical protein